MTLSALTRWKAAILEEHYSVRDYASWKIRHAWFQVSRIPFGGALMCRLVGHRWMAWSTPEPQPGIESLRRLHGWRCTRCPRKKRYGDRG